MYRPGSESQVLAVARGPATLAREQLPPQRGSAGALLWANARNLRIAAPLIAVFAMIALLAFTRTYLPWYITLPAAVGIVTGIHLLVRPGNDLRVWAIYAFGLLIFSYLHTIAAQTGIAAQSGYVIGLEKALFSGTVPTIWLQERLYIAGQTRLLDWVVLSVHASLFLLPPLIAFLVWRFNHANFRTAVTAILATISLALVVFFILPTVPPWMAAEQGKLPEIFRIVAISGSEASSGTYQAAREIADINAVAAMPSLHMAMAVIAALTALRGRRIVGALGVAYAALMAFSSVYGGEHYAVDILFGALLAIGAWKLAQRRSTLGTRAWSRVTQVTQLRPRLASRA